MERWRQLSQAIVVLVGLVLPSTTGSAQQRAGETADAAVQETTRPARATPLTRLLEAPPEYHTLALVNFVEAERATGMSYAGQYEGLCRLSWDVAAVLTKWLDDPPLEAEDRQEFVMACIRALRDVVKDQGTDELRTKLKEIATQEYGWDTLKNCAAFALAQLGDASAADALLRQHRALTESEDRTEQARGWQSLAAAYSQLRRYGDSVEADGGGVKYPRASLPNWMYNAACSMARAGQKTAALAQLERALRTGRDSSSPLRRILLEGDMDIASLRGEPRFAALMHEYYGIERPGPGDRPQTRKPPR
jgi:hypothetical protein